MIARIKKEMTLELSEDNFIKALEKSIKIESGFKIQHVEWWETDRIVYINLERKMKNAKI